MNNSSSYLKNERNLQQLMQQVEISDLEQLSELAKISKLQLFRLQNGLIEKMQLDTLLKISAALKISLQELIEIFSEEPFDEDTLQSEVRSEESASKIASLQQEYQTLQQQLERQKESLIEEFQRSSLQAIESWLLQWPTAMAAVEKNPLLPADRLIKLVHPLENLLKQWQVEPISFVGAEIPFDPQLHQLMEGNAESGDLVKVRYVGYRQNEKLLYRAKVSSLVNKI
jgi:molecular chaperone GrpE (heat shock protein)